jgi:hypothetical protein
MFLSAHASGKNVTFSPFPIRSPRDIACQRRKFCASRQNAGFYANSASANLAPKNVLIWCGGGNGAAKHRRIGKKEANVLGGVVAAPQHGAQPEVIIF